MASGVLQKSTLAPLGRPAAETNLTVSPVASWPLSSDLQLDNVFLRYRKDGPWALSGLTLHICSGEKVGICGRTGLP
jgi:ABC-type bacteriocin/lantibiotic exporter with double-glycine peptidase domain